MVAQFVFAYSQRLQTLYRFSDSGGCLQVDETV